MSTSSRGRAVYPNGSRCIMTGETRRLHNYAPFLRLFRVNAPAQRLLTLRPACSRSRLATLSIESSDSFVASTIVSIATGWSEPVPGRELHPLKSSTFHGALFHQLRAGGFPVSE